MTLTIKETHTLSILRENFLPSLRRELKIGKRYRAVTAQYGFNMCRHVSVFGVHLLREWLPDYKWEAWEATWTCRLSHLDETRKAKFDHSWIYGEKDGKGLFIDLTFSDAEMDSPIRNEDVLRDFQPVQQVEANTFPHGVADFYEVRVLEKRQLDPEALMDTKEIYTGKKGRRLFDDILRNANLSTE
ncbi:hypothetical protein IMZ31_19515 (plasmid) [Pontibacillus sp. ALD_SL1]|uniref:hypothetical protein n=1 Tax=Pontibacillus sp. ALD_SL1 TaxID=2777185 RepID=UPI001A970122|nr:hypothetical protein [Pontibacillus sp. ALD_SL1]QST02740.1 hypothetical protein IMZ31_19515 [Pontibacillus sp. ALD_SL1]